MIAEQECSELAQADRIYERIEDGALARQLILRSDRYLYWALS
jgi:hypothetical protein